MFPVLSILDVVASWVASDTGKGPSINPSPLGHPRKRGVKCPIEKKFTFSEFITCTLDDVMV